MSEYLTELPKQFIYPNVKYIDTFIWSEKHLPAKVIITPVKLMDASLPINCEPSLTYTVQNPTAL
jgi:hypothetical protein